MEVIRKEKQILFREIKDKSASLNTKSHNQEGIKDLSYHSQHEIDQYIKHIEDIEDNVTKRVDIVVIF